jgi:kinesin family protein 15
MPVFEHHGNMYYCGISIIQQEENNMLKIQNEDLSAKLRRTEVILSRVKEELARFRGSMGKNPYTDYDEEQRLSIKLKVSKHAHTTHPDKEMWVCSTNK